MGAPLSLTAACRVTLPVPTTAGAATEQLPPGDVLSTGMAGRGETAAAMAGVASATPQVNAVTERPQASLTGLNRPFTDRAFMAILAVMIYIEWMLYLLLRTEQWPLSGN